MALEGWLDLLDFGQTKNPRTMKNALLLSTLLCMYYTAQGQANGVFTLMHNGQASFFYQPSASLITIITTYAQAGDTIILPGGEVGPTGTITIDKPLTFIGAGIYPTGAPVTNITSMSQAGNVNNNLFITAAGSGSTFEGISFTRVIYFYSNVSNIRFSRCDIGVIRYANVNQSSPTNLGFSQCIMRSGMMFNSGIGLTMNNCILGGALSLGTQPSNGYINQCVFINVGTSSEGYNPGVIYTNCAFVSASTNGMAVNNASTYDHCLFAPTNGAVTFGTPPVHIGDHTATFNPTNIFTNANATAFDYPYNYTPAPNSPLLGNGVDGQNIGLYGPGTTGWKDLAIPSNPHWTQFTPNGNINTTGGTIQVHIKAEAQQN